MNEKNKKYLKYILMAGMVLLLSTIIMVVTLMFSSAQFNREMFDSYFKSMELIALNLLPVIVLMSILYLLFNRLWISFFISSSLFVIASLVNKFKLTYRDDPFTFIDVKLFSESIAMTKRYDIVFTWKIVAVLVGFLVITVLLKMFFKYKIDSKKIRISIGALIIIVFSFTFKGLYFDKTRYKELGDKSLINIWSEQQQFESKGFVYPFMHSINDARDYVLEDYDEAKAIKSLAEYKYLDIPDDKKVNVVGIMLEAYNDFSKFETIEIDEEVYKDFHEIQKQSLHGDLVTNVFAGGTINTERGFLTGYQDHPKYLGDTNSFAWYFKEQGYNTKAMHPIYGWFYNRRNVNEYLGFDSFDYYENKYEAEQKEFFMDMEFFDYIIEDYEKSVAENKPYFHFSVTYQNHGPYSDEKLVDKEYLKKKPEYNESDYNIVNNYLHGISQTTQAIKKLTDYFESQDEPTVVVMFGDHNPWLGEGSSAYAMMDINMDISTEEGFTNYYKTPYIIWGNTSAKQVVGKEFVEKSEDLSPNFLMPEMFEYLEWTGNQYMQYLVDLKNNITVNNVNYFKADGEYTRDLNGENAKKYKEFRNLQYYYGRNFIDNKK